MHLLLCKDQQPGTLEEFYTNLSHDAAPVFQAMGAAMLDLLVRLRALPPQRWVYGLTSHARLCLLARDTHESPRYVTITAWNKSRYVVEFQMPYRTAPWSEARVKGEARSEDQAVEMILTAMEKSEGWNDTY